MNLERNRIPEKVQSVHLIAICGTGMAALACMLKDLGFAVTGSDQNVYPPMSTYLAAKKIDIYKGFHGDNLAHRPDLVVVGNAVSKDNAEVLKMDQMGLCFCSMPQAVNAFVAKDKKTILVAGTHGKTTTSSLIAWLLKTGGVDVSFVIGGILSNFESNYRLGNSDYVVIEGDEYDTAFFDKGPKFMHYRPLITVLTSIEFDHADIFRDISHVERIFKDFISGLGPESVLIACYDDKTVSAFSGAAGCRVVGYGIDPSAVWQIKNRSITPPWSLFDVFQSGQYIDRFKTGLMGAHNLANALAAIAVADQLGIPGTSIQEALKTFSGVKRRQELRGIRRGVTVIDDFAHHPTAVRETIRAVKPFYGNGRLIVVFEPRTNTSMRDIFQNVYPDAFKGADLICIREPSLLNKIPAGHRFSSACLVNDLQARGMDAHYFENTDRIIDFLVLQVRSGDTILVMSNGGFDNIHERLLERL
jgi:UDP-N-acetylmuramate: L-alanyl-gamma-D-glutamyl-meso-diaminopimelate ligase